MDSRAKILEKKIKKSSLRADNIFEYEYLMNNNLVKTKLLKTCRNTLLRNIDKLWNNYYFKLLDA